MSPNITPLAMIAKIFPYGAKARSIVLLNRNSSLNAGTLASVTIEIKKSTNVIEAGSDIMPEASNREPISEFTYAADVIMPIEASTIGIALPKERLGVSFIGFSCVIALENIIRFKGCFHTKDSYNLKAVSLHESSVLNNCNSCGNLNLCKLVVLKHLCGNFTC